MKIKLFTYAYLEELKSAVSNLASLPLYTGDEFLVKDECVWEHPVITIDEDIVLHEPSGHRKTQYEYENGKIIFEKIHGLKPDYATDPRIWTYLTHTIFWKYMQKRSIIPVDIKKDENRANHILTHWFVVSSSANNLMRNDISRLWWITYLTYDEKRSDPYELTKLAFRDMDQTRTIYTGYQGRNRKMIKAIFEFEKNNPDLFANYREDKYRSLMKRLNYYGSYKILSSMNNVQLKELLEGCKDFLTKIG